jgi:putative endonuclease
MADERPRTSPPARHRCRSTPRASGRVPTGISAESRAAAFLIAKGFRILARRWRSPVGEIDIVARRRALLVFVEVKARETRTTRPGRSPNDKRARIIAAAQVWLARFPDSRVQDIRFDAMLVAPGRLPRHIPAAFDASMRWQPRCDAGRADASVQRVHFYSHGMTATAASPP